MPAPAHPDRSVGHTGQTATGIQFVQPKGWNALANGAVTVFVSPEFDLRVVLVDVDAAANARAAAKAWSLYKPALMQTLRLVTAAPAAEGWDKRELAYVTAPNERAARSALALR